MENRLELPTNEDFKEAIGMIVEFFEFSSADLPYVVEMGRQIACSLGKDGSSLKEATMSTSVVAKDTSHSLGVQSSSLGVVKIRTKQGSTRAAVPVPTKQLIIRTKLKNGQSSNVEKKKDAQCLEVQKRNRDVELGVAHKKARFVDHMGPESSDTRSALKDTSSKDKSSVEVMGISLEELHSFSPEQNNLVLSVSDPCYTRRLSALIHARRDRRLLDGIGNSLILSVGLVFQQLESAIYGR